ncbi:MFS transporter (plasmid) [Pantoea agglomerans]|nr:MFS transporter [Pantoea agglomerans]
MSTVPLREKTVLSSGMLLLLALACGITVSNVYLSQPILNEIAMSFNVSPDRAGLVTTLAQTGYAIGILFIVPSADSLSPRKLSGMLLLLTTVMLLGCGLAPSLTVLIVASFFLTLFTVIPQILIPLAVSMAEKGETGRVIGTVQTGLILGILLSRTASGFLADVSATWRASFIVFAVLDAWLLIVLIKWLPLTERSPLSLKKYVSLLASMPRLLLAYPALILSCLMGCLVFAAFSAFWATLAYYLASPAFNMNPADIGLFGLWGAAGAMLAPRAGRLCDRFGVKPVNLLSLLSVACAFILFMYTRSYAIPALVLGVNLLDFGLQSGQIANQARIFALPGEYRARLNTLYMVFTFFGGAAGAAAGSYFWSISGWMAVCQFALVLLLAALALLFLIRTSTR